MTGPTRPAGRAPRTGVSGVLEGAACARRGLVVGAALVAALPLLGAGIDERPGAPPTTAATAAPAAPATSPRGAPPTPPATSPGGPPTTTPAKPSAPREGADFQVPPPPFTEGIYPCTTCHDNKERKTNPAPRKLVEMHDDIVLEHAPRMWCLDCHNPAERDYLRLADGERLEFGRSFLLCAQCHGDKYRDWRYGIHGKRTGSWNGAKQYLLCVHCHSPHQPRFKPLKPAPPPVPPSEIRREEDPVSPPPPQPRSPAPPSESRREEEPAR